MMARSSQRSAGSWPVAAQVRNAARLAARERRDVRGATFTIEVASGSQQPRREPDSFF
jgi:hypothetical protein